MREGILIVPVGPVESRVLRHISDAVTETFGQEPRLGGPLPPPRQAFDALRRQYSAEAILRGLERGEAERVLGVADLDLHVPQANFVFGLAEPAQRRGVIGLSRLRQRLFGMGWNESLYFARAAKEAVHELGHTYGLEHCANRRCVMAFSNRLADTDAKSEQFCPSCLEKLAASVDR